MEIRSILVGLAPKASSVSSLGAALDLAHRFGAKLSLCTAAQPRLESAGAELSPVAVDAYERQRREIEEGLAILEGAFENTVPAEMRGRYRGLIAAPTPHLIASAAAADLVLLPTTGLHGRLRETDLGEVIVTCGRPVLVIPEQTAIVHAEHVVVAWKNTREARRAVADALPFLKAAADVHVVSVEEGDYAAEHDGLKDILGWMKAHEVNATGDIVPLHTTVHDAVESVAAENKAEFIVTGGYGHTRLREWLLGGATLDLLADKSRCRLFSN